jgi:coenzyme F420 hydrogenase subunit beta
MSRRPYAIETIVEYGLCIGCGLCQSIAGPGRLRVEMTPGGRERPRLLEPLDEATLARIDAVCPGVRVEGFDREPGGDGFGRSAMWGPAAGMATAYAADPEIRFQAATGGVLSALCLHLLESGKVDFILHVAASAERPMQSVRHVSVDRETVMAGSGSRYGPAAVLIDFCQRLDEGRRFAVVGKPCDIAAVRNLARLDPRVEALVPYCLSLMCGGASELTMARNVAGWHGVAEEEVASMRFRGYGNPGPTRIVTKDGRVHDTVYNEIWEDTRNWQLQFRCKICPDAIGELADLVAYDVWPGGAPSGEDEGFNGVLARTPEGLALLREAEAAGVLTVTTPIDYADLDDFQPHQIEKKEAIVGRVAALALARQPTPRFRRLRLLRVALGAGPLTNLRAFIGMLRRIRRGANREPPA